MEKELKEILRPLLKLNFDHEGNVNTLVKVIIRFVNKNNKKGDTNEEYNNTNNFSVHPITGESILAGSSH